MHAQNYGWLDWAKNGESAGTEGFGYRLEGICIEILPAGSEAPGNVDYPFVSANEFLNKIKGDWYSLKRTSTLPGLKINGNPYEECGLLWLGSKYYEYRYRIIYVAQDCKSGTFEAYEQNYYKPPSSGNSNWQKVPIAVSDIYQLNVDNTITRTAQSYTETFRK
ncbi:Clostridial hydrophobic W [anaerobic digester metagenome]